MSRVVGVILAAGKATRIMPLSRHTPKPLLPVGNRPIVAYQIDQMRAAGVEDVHVVVGPLGGQVREVLGDGGAWGVNVSYAEQEQPLGIAHALAQVSDRIGDPFFVFLGDIYSSFAPGRDLNAMKDLLEAGDSGAVLTVKHEPNEQAIRANFAVHEEQGRVVKVVEKPTGELPNDLRGCGVYLFRPSFFEAIASTPRSEIRGEYEITDSIQSYIDGGERVTSTSIVDWDMNITFPSDLLRCNLKHLLSTARDKIVAEGAKLHPGCSVQHCVIGEGVVVTKDIRIRRSVVLAGARIDAAEDVEDAVIGPSDSIVCPGVSS